MATIWDRYYKGMPFAEIKAINPFSSEGWLGDGENLSQKRIGQFDDLFDGKSRVSAARIKKLGSNFGRYAAFRAIVHGIAIPDNAKGIIKIEKYAGNNVFPDEVITTPGDKYHEGSLKQVTVNAYERDPVARQKCIDRHGSICKICGFDFERKYGDIGRGYIHVHHIRPLSEIGKEYEVDPMIDLIPVCPNCHVIVHKRKPPYSIEEVKEMMEA